MNTPSTIPSTYRPVSFYLVSTDPPVAAHKCAPVWEFLYDPVHPEVGTRVRYFTRGKGYPPIDEAWIPPHALPSRAAEEKLWRHDWNLCGAANKKELLVPLWDWELLTVDEGRAVWDALVGTGAWTRALSVPNRDKAWGPLPPDGMTNSNGKVHCPQAFHQALCRVFGTTTRGGATVPNIPQDADMGFAHALTA